MNQPTRRDFLKTTAPALAAASLQPGLFAVGAEEKKKLTVGFIGCGGRSQSLSDGFRGHVDVAWVCDPDTTQAARLKERTGANKVIRDLREGLADDSVDAVVVATPDHWHAPASILACNAGKHVYVEKPCSHNIVEGQQLVAAARRNNVIVQHGTQSRSMPIIVNAMQLLKEGIIGDVLVSKAWNIQRRANIGHAAPSTPPKTLDYDLWLGPAEEVPFQSNRFHYTWHWWHNFGTGDAGNDGVHELDYARWGLGVQGLPTRVAGLGNKLYFDDDQQFPDSIHCTYEWPGDDTVGTRRQLIFEMRIWSTTKPMNIDNGVEYYGTKGRMVLTKRGKMEIFNERNQRIENPEPKLAIALPENHQVDFLNSIRSGKAPHAEIAIGHDSSALAHLANATARLGRSIEIDPKTQRAVNDNEANALFGRKYRQNGHWSIPQNT